VTTAKKQRSAAPSPQLTVAEIFDMLEPFAREKFVTEGRVEVRHLVFTPTGILYIANVDCDPDVHSAAVREIAAERNAYAVATMAEVRIISSDKPREAFPQSFKGHPQAVEAVTVMVEYRDDGHTVARADITREVPGDESSRGTLGPFARAKPERMTIARLSHMLPGARDN